MTDGSLVSARLLVFRVGALVCAAEVDQVREILPRLPTTRIPGAPPVVAGLVNVRGTLVTVVEGWRALGQAPPGPPASPPAETSQTQAPEAAGSTIILEMGKGESGAGATGAHEGQLIGFTVDEVMDMLAGGATTLEDRTGLPGVDPTLVRAVGRRNGELFIVLDVAALLGPILTT
ncbi:MAG TPA: chemotaxis protein CheW [Gemmatimonadales bacterium]|nr:chemotaxis protein CheW [Gemmatimonadales bacterium]